MDFSELCYIDETGYHFEDYPTILSWLQNEFRSIYGADIYIEPDSQDGQWIAVLAKALYDSAALGASVYNSFSPVTAQGVGLSRNVKINGLERIDPTYSTVDVLITGTSGTVIGVSGAPGVVIDTLEQKWNIPVGTTIPGGGSITVTATAQEVGAVNAAANTVNRIFTPTRGWQSVNNVAAATAGIPIESDSELRARQIISTANPSTTVLQGTEGAVGNLSGVTKVRGYENDTGAVDANGLPAHSISIVTLGGDVTEICETIMLHKTPGTATYGDTTQVVTDPRGLPISISFERSLDVPIDVEIVLTPKTGWSSDYETLIAEAVSETIDAFGIGNDVLYTRLFVSAYLQGTPAFGTFDIVTIEISRDGDPVAAANVDIAWNEYPSCDPLTNVTITA